MKKKYFENQLQRLLSLYDEPCDDYWAEHYRGHQKMAEEIMCFLHNMPFDRKKLNQWLKKRIRFSENVLKKLDARYNYFAQDEDMSPEDEINYAFHDGKICFALDMRFVLKKKRYYEKR